MNQQRKLFESFMALYTSNFDMTYDAVTETYLSMDVQIYWTMYTQGWTDLERVKHLERYRDGGQ
jgi:hypothetical protein